LRSALTLLGVVISVAAVITVVTFVAGIQDTYGRNFQSWGGHFCDQQGHSGDYNIDEFLEGQKRKRH